MQSPPRDEAEIRPEWLQSINQRLLKAHQDNESSSAASSSANAICIYRVPKNLKDAYAPRFVSLGPYHRGRQDLGLMDDKKWRILDRVCTRNCQSIEYYVKAMIGLLGEVKGCYEGQIELTDEDFVEMMILDGIFVLELLLRRHGKLRGASNDEVFSNRTKVLLILEDMVKLENQLPLFILEELWRLQFQNKAQNGEIADMIVRLFSRLMPTDGSASVHSRGRRGLHCLDVLRNMCVVEQVNENSEDNFEDEEFIRSVTELRKSGIRFKQKEKAPLCGVTFNNGTLEIPQIKIYGFTTLLFLNFIAFEQCHQHSGNMITSYVFLMDSLINTENDVAHLHNCRIIEHWLGSNNEVADQFNNICKGVIFDNRRNHFSPLSRNVTQYSAQKCNLCVSDLRQKYFSHPWAYVAFFVATYILLLDTAQTFYAIYGYHHPKKT